MNNYLYRFAQLTFFIFVFSVFNLIAGEDKSVIHDKALISDLAGKPIPLVNQVKYLKQSDQSFSAKDMRSNLSLMKPISEEKINFGFQRDVYWYSFVLKNDTDSEESIFLNIDYPLLDDIQLHVFERSTGAQVMSIQMGDKFRFNQRTFNHSSFIVPLSINSNQEFDVLIRVHTESTMQLPMYLETKKNFAESSFTSALLYGLNMGVLIVMALYNFLIYLSIKDKSYLLLAINFALFTIFSLAITGKGFQFLWPESPNWNTISVPFFAFITLVAFIYFFNSLLDIKENLKKYYPIIKYFTFWLWLCVVLVFFISYQIAVIGAIASLFISLVIAISTGIAIFRKGYRPARFFVLGFAALMVGTIIWALNLIGVLEQVVLSKYAINIGGIFCVSLFSLALADRINDEKRTRESAQNESIRNLNNYKALYDNAIEGYFQADYDGLLISCNQTFLDIFGKDSLSDLTSEKFNLFNQVLRKEQYQNECRKALMEEGEVLGFDFYTDFESDKKLWLTLFARVNTVNEAKVIEGSIVDVTSTKEKELELDYLTKYDVLTGLLNRDGLTAYLNNALETNKKFDTEHAFMKIDIDQFKIINDTSGLAVGDLILKEIGSLILEQLRANDRIARLGGDEFAILLENCDIETATEIGERLRKRVRKEEFLINEKNYQCTVSVGITPISSSVANIEKLLSIVNTACYMAKDSGRNRVVVHDEESGEVSKRQNEMGIIGDLRDAIQKDSLVLYKQSIQAINSDFEGERYEILVRMKMNGEIIPPGVFLPAAERYNMISAVDRWVIEAYCRYLRDNPENAARLAQANINLSGQTINEQGFSAFLEECFEKYQVPISKLCFEVTESSAVASLSTTSEFIQRMRQKGLKFALDDFGSGYTSYAYLKSLPVNSVKIDGAFIKEILNDNFDNALVKSITDLAHTIGLNVVAEFVETGEILEHLGTLGVDLAQGYYIDKPQPLIE